MDKQILRNLLQNGISANPLMTQGTSIESIFETANTGKLPSGKCYVSDDEVSFQDCGRLYFTPATSNIKNPPKNLLDIGREESIRESKLYAKLSSFMHYMAASLGCTTPEAYSAIYRNIDLSGDNKTKQKVGKELFIGMKSDLEDAGITTSTDRLLSLYKNAKKRKGVIIEPNESIMELPHSTDFDKCSISFECPEGLDIKYIRGISLLGNVEKKLMERFLDGKLKYNGFRTDMLSVAVQ